MKQHAGAIACLRIAAAGAAVRKVDQDLDALLDDVMRLEALKVSHKADAAGVVFEARIVKTLRRW